jgi:hypothetical protein
MAYATSRSRARLIVDLRRFADFLESRADLPAPAYLDVLVFPTAGTDSAMRAEIDRIATVLGTDTEEDGGHYATGTAVGLISYRVVAILADSRAQHAALMSYQGAVQPETSSSDQISTTDMEVR